MWPGAEGEMGDAWRERAMQVVVGGSVAPELVVAMTGDGLLPPSKLSPRLNSFSKLPHILVPVLTFESLRPYGPVEGPDGRDEAVETRGRAAPMGSNGSRLCLEDLGGERANEELRSSVKDSPMLSVPSVSVSCLVKGARCTGTAE